MTGNVQLARELDFEDRRYPHIYQLLVTGSEGYGTFNTSVELTIRVLDVNDNAPVFEMEEYYNIVDEDIPIGSPIIKVKASDADSGDNADITYSVSLDDYFAVDSDGWITNIRRLDTKENRFFYFNVTATDSGEVARTGTAAVRILTESRREMVTEREMEVRSRKGKAVASSRHMRGGVEGRTVSVVVVM